MKVLIVVPAISEVYGGTSGIATGWAQALSCQDVTVDIVTTNANGTRYLDVPLRKWIVQSGYRIQYFPCLTIGDYKWSNLFAVWLFSHVQDYDLIHTNAVFSLPNLPAHWACQWHRIPYIMTPHGMLEPWALSYKGSKKRWYFRLFGRSALNSASAIHSTASLEAKNLQKLNLKSPVILIPNGIHKSNFDNLPSPEIFLQRFPYIRGKKIILFLGRIDPKKGLDLLSSAFSHVCKSFSETHLVVAGPDNIGFLPIAKQYFLEAGCIDAVTFTGMLTGDLKFAALAAANLYVAPSYSEGFSMSILEGMASGLPCVITTGCNFPEAAAANVVYEVIPTVEQISNALSQCLQDPDGAKATGNRARQFIFENYTWNRIAARLIDVYTAILNRQTLPDRASSFDQY